jgi:hypothetical protein
LVEEIYLENCLSPQCSSLLDREQGPSESLARASFSADGHELEQLNPAGGVP